MTTERTMLSPHEEIVLHKRVSDPEAAFDRLLAQAADSQLRARIQAVKALPEDEQQAFLLSGARPLDRVHRMVPATGCAVVVVVVTVTVIIGWIIVDGIREALTEEREVEQEIEQCIEDHNNRSMREFQRATAEPPVLLAADEQIVAGKRIDDPGAVLTALLAQTSAPELRLRIEQVQQQPVSAQADWLTERSRALPARLVQTIPGGCAVVVTVVVVTVIVGWQIVNGIREALTQQREVEREVMECVEQQNQPDAEDTDEVQIGGTTEVGTRQP